MIEFTYDDAAGTLTISERKGEFPGMLKERVFNVVPVSKAGKGLMQKVSYDGTEIVIGL